MTRTPYVSSRPPLRVKCLREGRKKIRSPPSPFLALYISRSNNNFVKHAKPPKSPARDRGSCAAPEPGRCKGRTELCNAGTRAPQSAHAHAHTKKPQRKTRQGVVRGAQSRRLTELMTFVSLFKITRAKKNKTSGSSGNLIVDVHGNALVNRNNDYKSFMASQAILRGLQVEAEVKNLRI